MEQPRETSKGGNGNGFQKMVERESNPPQKSKLPFVGKDHKVSDFQPLHFVSPALRFCDSPLPPPLLPPPPLSPPVPFARGKDVIITEILQMYKYQHFEFPYYHLTRRP